MLTSTFGSVLLASVLACLVTMTGIYIIMKYEKWGNQNVVYFVSFAAGVLISVSFIHPLLARSGHPDSVFYCSVERLTKL